MKFLSLISYFSKNKKNVKTSPKNVTETICKEHSDLYDDEDFLEVLAMSSEEVRADIRSYQESPDEIVALIRGRLDNKITPLKNNKETINIMTFLSSLIDKKIIMDAFNKSKKKNTFRDSFSSLPAILIVSVVAFFVAPPIIGNSDYTFVKKENIALIQKNKEQINNMKRLIEKQKLELARYESIRDNFVDSDTNDTPLVALSPLHEDSSLTISLLNKSLSDDYLVTTSFYNKPINTEYNIDSNISSQAVISLASRSNEDLNFNLKYGDNLYHLFKKNDLLVNNWNTLNGLSSLQAGSKLIIKTDNNYVKEIKYIRRDGSITNYEIKDRNIKKHDSKLYYAENIVITGNIDTSLSASLKNNELFKNNISIARIITQKVEQYLKTDASIDFRKMRPNAPYKIEISVRKNRSNDKIIHVDKVKVDQLDNYVIASNTST